MNAVTLDAATLAAAAAAKKKPALPRAALAVGTALAVGAAGAAWILAPKGSVSTDAAYIQADSATVAPKVRGLIAEVFVRDNQPVKRGDPLLRIDPEEFDARLASAGADLADARAGVAAAHAALVALDAEERLAASTIVAAQTTIGAADAQRDRAEADRRRYDALVGAGAVAEQEADRYRAAAISARSDSDRVRAALAVSRDQAGVVRARRAALEAKLAEAQAGEARSTAALDLARQDRDHSLVRAPIDGVVGERHAEPGDYVQPGSRLMTVAPLRALYVTANFKETQTARMTAGQPATIKVDALPGQKLKGVVESFAPGTGSQFALLPFEPGTGNFTKIVQRVPVRIRLDPGQPAAERLRPGLSTTVVVDLRAAR